jgi:hypothetical protein
MRNVFKQRIRRARLEALEPRDLLSVVPLGHPEPIVTPDHARPTSMLTADFDLDGDVDLLAETAEGVVYFRNLDGRGDFQLVQVPGVSGADFAADLDSDGDTDLIHVGVDYTITTYLNNGQAQFIVASQSGARLPFVGAQVSDVDGDGDLDLAGFGRWSWNPLFVWFENDGAGHLLEAASRVERDPSERLSSSDSRVLADLDADGDVDLLRTTRRNGNRVIFYENTGSEFLAGRELLMVPGQAETILPPTDLDKDGDADLMFGRAWGPAIVYWNNLAHNSPSPSDFASVMDDFPYGPEGSRWLVDVDSDGDDDLVAQSYRGDLQWYENDAARFGAPRPVAKFTDYSELSLVDVDGDGDLDVAAATASSDSVAWYENDGLKFEPHVLIEGEFDAISKVVPADLDADGDLDLVTLDRRGIVWHQNMGDGTFSGQRIVAGEVNDLDVGELDQDGRGLLDVVYATDSETVAMLSEGWSQSPRTVVLGSGAHKLQIASINGDHENDVVTATKDGLLTAYESYQGIPTVAAFSQPVQFYLARGNLSDFDIGDIDGDGDVDLVASSVYVEPLGRPEDGYTYIYLLETVGQYFDFPTTLFSWNIGDDGAFGIRWVEIGDVNADGANDLLWSGEPYEDRPTLAGVEFGADGLVETYVIDVEDKFEDILGQDLEYYPGEVELVDVNRDGRPEVFSRGGHGFLYEFRDDGSVTREEFYEIRVTANTDGAVTVGNGYPYPGLRYFGDFDGDGDVDVVVANDNRIDLLRNLQERVDLDKSGQIDARDVDLVWAAIQSGDPDPRIDLNEDGQVDERDGTHLLVNSLRRSIADVNLDGVFNRLDLVSVMQAGKYGSDDAATWSQGDWNMDGRFDMLDLVLALQTDSYVVSRLTQAFDSPPST